MIELRSVSKRYGDREVLRSVSLHLEPGELLWISGESGSGKTVLLALLLGLEIPTEGAMFVDDINLHDVPPDALALYRRRIGTVFQNRAVLAHLTVEENIRYPLECLGMPSSEIALAVDGVCAALRLESLRKRRGSDLSAAEQTLVALARAVAHRPLILLTDDLLGPLNEAQSGLVLGLLASWSQEGVTAVLFSREQEAPQGMTRCLRLADGQLHQEKMIAETETAKGRASRHSSPLTESAETLAAPETTKTKRSVHITGVNV